jgi:rhamnosyltransferase
MTNLKENEYKPNFVVCLAAYTGLAYIKEQIQSILQQKKVNLQIVVSVDRSTDGTEAYLSDWAFTEPRLVLLPIGERFGGAASNFYRLLREVDLNEFDYVSFADQDDIWHPEKLWRAHNLMLQSGVHAYSSNVTAFWPSTKTQLINKAQAQQPMDFMFEAAGPGCTYVLQASLALSLQKVVRAAEKRIQRVEYHDWLIYAFARANKYSWVIDEWPSMQYRQHAHNQIGVNKGWRAYWFRVKKVLTGYGFQQAMLISDIVGGTSTYIAQQGLRRGRLGYLWLAMHAGQCRRKRVDKLWFFIACVLLAVIGPKIKAFD